MRSAKWGCITYDTCRSRIMAALVDGGVVAAISPVHDSDTWTDHDVAVHAASWTRRRGHWLGDLHHCAVDRWQDAVWMETPDGPPREMPVVGESKKSHVHVLVRWGGACTRERTIERLSALGIDVAMAQPVHSWDAALRYMAHLDSPDKAEYRAEDILTVGAPSVRALREPAATVDVSYAVGRILAMRSPTVAVLVSSLAQDGDEPMLRWVSGHMPLVTQLVGCGAG